MPGEVCLADLGLAAKTRPVIDLSRETFSQGWNLDAIHLATALSIREIENVDLLLTRDSQLTTAAEVLDSRMEIDQ
jgi:hypothetical protein